MSDNDIQFSKFMDAIAKEMLGEAGLLTGKFVIAGPPPGYTLTGKRGSNFRG